MVSRKRQVLNVLQDSEGGKEEKGGRNSEKGEKEEKPNSMSLEAKTSLLQTRSLSGKRREMMRKVGGKQEAGVMRGGGDP